MDDLSDMISRIDRSMERGEFDRLSRVMTDMATGTMQSNELVERIAWLRTTYMFRDRLPGWAKLRQRIGRECEAIGKPEIVFGLPMQ